MTDREPSRTATQVVLSFTPGDDHTANAVDQQSYRSYLRRTRAGSVAVGAEWEEFVSRGCGKTRDVVFRVESVTGGEAIGEGTQFVFEPGDRPTE